MTIAGRNKTRLAAISITALIIIAASIIIFYILRTNNSIPSAGIAQRIEKKTDIQLFGINLQNFALTRYSMIIASISIFACSIYSLVLLIYIYFTFKKTHALEISFFTAFIFSMGFESLRLLFPVYNFSSLVFENTAFISRFVYFFRLTGLISLFVGSIFALKIITRQVFYLLFFIAFISFSIIISIPINNFALSNYFIAEIKYTYSYTFITWAAAVLACFNYFLAYITKNSKEYLTAAIMLVLIMSGYGILIYSGSFLTFMTGSMLLLSGTLFYAKSIHTYHLWE